MKPNTTQTILLGLLLLASLSPLVHSQVAIYGTIVHRTLYFWAIVDGMALWFILSNPFQRLSFTAIQAALLLYGLAILLSNVLGIDPYLNLFSSFERMMGMVNYGHFIIYAFLLSQNRLTKQQLFYWAIASLVVGGIVSLMGLTHLEASTHYRVVSVLSSAMHMAIYELFLVYLSIFIFFQNPSRIGKVALGLATVLFLITLYFTQTRAAGVALLLGMAVGGLAYLYQINKRYFAMLLIGGISMFALGVWGLYHTKLQYLESLPIQRAGAISGRLKLWQMTSQHLFQRPILGWGEGSFNYFYFQNYTANLHDVGYWYDSAHNLILDTIVRHGWWGLFTFFLLIWATAKAIYTTHTPLNLLQKSLLMGLLASYLIFMLFGFDSFISLLGFYTFIGVLASYQPQIVTWTVSFKPVWITFTKSMLVVVVLGANYFFVWQTIASNSLLTKACRTNNFDEMLQNLQKGYHQSLIGQYDFAVELALKRGDVFTASIPKFAQQLYQTQTESILKDALQNHPNHPVLLTQLALVQMAANAKEQGLKTLEKINQLSPHRQINRYDYASALVEMNRLSDALKELDGILSETPQYTQAILLKARICFRLNRTAEGINAWKSLSKKDRITYFETMVTDAMTYNMEAPFLTFMQDMSLDDWNTLSHNDWKSWLKIAQKAKNRQQVKFVLSLYVNRFLLVNGHFQHKSDSLSILRRIDTITEGLESVEVVDEYIRN